MVVPVESFFVSRIVAKLLNSDVRFRLWSRQESRAGVCRSRYYFAGPATVPMAVPVESFFVSRIVAKLLNVIFDCVKSQELAFIVVGINLQVRPRCQWWSQ